MSDQWVCAQCGVRYGAEWGHCSGLCTDCERGSNVPKSESKKMNEDKRTERLYNLHDHVLVRGRGKMGEAVAGTIWGYEWSDGLNVAGKPLVRYRGWFYHVREEGSGDSAIVPENILAKSCASV